MIPIRIPNRIRGKTKDVFLLDNVAIFIRVEWGKNWGEKNVYKRERFFLYGISRLQCHKKIPHTQGKL